METSRRVSWCLYERCASKRMSVMRSSRRQHNLPPEASTAMENVEGRNSKSASDARASPSPSPMNIASLVSLPVSSMARIFTIYIYIP